METVTTIEGSTTAQLRTLLSMAREDDIRINLVPPGLDNEAELERELGRLYQKNAAADDVPTFTPWMPGIIATVRAPDTPLPVLMGLKSLARSLAARVESAQERAAVMILDCAADAAALVHHRHDICVDSANTLLAIYEDLGRIMAAEPLGLVFNKAAEQLAQRVSSAK